MQGTRLKGMDKFKYLRWIVRENGNLDEIIQCSQCGKAGENARGIVQSYDQFKG